MNSEQTSSPTSVPSRDADVSQQIGEGSYEGTKEYQKSIGAYLKEADVAADAKAAKPDTEAQAAELKQAEREGLSHSKAKGQ